MTINVPCSRDEQAWTLVALILLGGALGILVSLLRGEAR